MLPYVSFITYNFKFLGEYFVFKYKIQFYKHVFII